MEDGERTAKRGGLEQNGQGNGCKEKKQSIIEGNVSGQNEQAERQEMSLYNPTSARKRLPVTRRPAWARAERGVPEARRI